MSPSELPTIVNNSISPALRRSNRSRAQLRPISNPTLTDSTENVTNTKISNKIHLETRSSRRQNKPEKKEPKSPPSYTPTDNSSIVQKNDVPMPRQKYDTLLDQLWQEIPHEIRSRVKIDDDVGLREAELKKLTAAKIYLESLQRVLGKRELVMDWINNVD